MIPNRELDHRVLSSVRQGSGLLRLIVADMRKLLGPGFCGGSDERAVERSLDRLRRAKRVEHVGGGRWMVAGPNKAAGA